MTAFGALDVRSRDGIFVITLNRPDVLNRFDATLELELTSALASVADDPTARVVVLLSQGKVFSAGGDFDLMLECNVDLETRLAALQRARKLLEVITTLPIPLIAGVQGAAIGLGATVAVGSDVVVASRNARIADTHVAVGLTAGDGGALFWPQSVGTLRARRYLLTGDALTAEMAYEFGLVTDLVDEPSEVESAAMSIAERIAALPPLGVRGTKFALNQLTRQRAGEVVETALMWEGATLGSNDLAEAVSAFKQKRVGKYEGR
ncbi:enoyl-CoA hydratase/isomerase family protein [Nocardia sp. NPDC059239]|uniref:enoyl-CoA hydratase/isomerase family protein n=1 Tax=unclassified Nocardia TaxID=2637762 RepID=UPI00367F5297